MRVFWRHFDMGVNIMEWRKARGIIKDHAQRPSCYRLALMTFLAQKPEPPQDTQMAFPVFAPKTLSAPNDSCLDVAEAFIRSSCLPLHYDMDANGKMTPKDAFELKSGTSGFRVKNNISAKQQQLGRHRWTPQIFSNNISFC